MSYQAIGLGASADDGTGDSLRIGADKVNDNFVELYTLFGDASDLSSGISSTATVITLTNPVITGPTISGVVGGTQTSATITTVTSTTVNAGTLALAAGSVTDSSGAISFGNENLTTTGTFGAGNITVGTITSTGPTIVLEGATSVGNQTTLTVGAPTADRTITFPNITGTVITTGDSSTVSGTMIANDAIDSSHYTDGSIDLTHMSDDSIDSDQYVDGSIDLVHMSVNSIDSDQYVDGSIDSAHLADDAIIIKINAQTGTTYTSVLTDFNKLVTLSNGSAITLTIPPNSSVAYPIGTVIAFTQIGSGTVTTAQGSGVTIRSRNGLVSGGQYAVWSLTKFLSDTWVLAGDVTSS